MRIQDIEKRHTESPVIAKLRADHRSKGIHQS